MHSQKNSPIPNHKKSRIPRGSGFVFQPTASGKVEISGRRGLALPAGKWYTEGVLYAAVVESADTRDLKFEHRTGKPSV